jgi:3-hydroxyacyl-[acyl-carrier-protein] dehydratase
MTNNIDIGELIPAPGNPLQRDTIERILPHRDPFLWLTRIIEHEPGVRVVAELDVDSSLPLFSGHFPAYPVLPGVIIMEALAQAAAFTLLSAPENQGKVGFFGGIDKAKFREQVRPGDTLTLTAEITKSNARSARTHVVATVGDKKAAEADQFYVMASVREQ